MFDTKPIGHDHDAFADRADLPTEFHLRADPDRHELVDALEGVNKMGSRFMVVPAALQSEALLQELSDLAELGIGR